MPPDLDSFTMSVHSCSKGLFRVLKSLSGVIEPSSARCSWGAAARFAHQPACVPTSLRPPSPPSIVKLGWIWRRSLGLSNLAPAPFSQWSQCMGSRGYKVITSAIIDVPKLGPRPGVKGTKQNPRSVSESCNRMTRWLQEARMPEGWSRRKFYIKPKYRRAQRKWAGVLKRKRRDFNYKLRWALKSMTRCAPLMCSFVTVAHIERQIVEPCKLRLFSRANVYNSWLVL